MIQINLLHVVVIFPFLLWLVKTLLDHKPVPEIAVQSLGVVAVAGLLYHASKIVKFVQMFGVAALFQM